MDESEIREFARRRRERNDHYSPSPAEEAEIDRRTAEWAETRYGHIAAAVPEPDGEPRGQAAIVCPHCQTQGHVRRSAATRKRGISGGKATGAVLTAGISLLGTGLSRKVKGVQFDCGNCGTSWFVD